MFYTGADIIFSCFILLLMLNRKLVIYRRDYVMNTVKFLSGVVLYILSYAHINRYIFGDKHMIYTYFGTYMALHLKACCSAAAILSLLLCLNAFNFIRTIIPRMFS